jgi:dTDP-glucose pyrophosphorylase
MNGAEKHLIRNGSTIKDALERLNSLGNYLTLFVVDEASVLLGTITDGDIRRAMLRGVQIISTVESVMNTNYTALRIHEYSIEEIKTIRERLIKLIPVIDVNGKILRLINLEKIKTLLPFDAVIMAGGEGRRLKPMTDHTPKPLLKIGNKPIIEYNIDRLTEFGIENCYITIKYLGSQLREYFKDGSEKEINIHYVEELSDPLGTIGSVSLIDSFTHENVLQEFKKSNADMAVATIPYRVNIPYAVLETNSDLIVGFKEKPTYTYYSNGGIYLFKREVLDIIPKGQFFNATDLMDHLISNNKRVVTYPLYCYWLDIGMPEDFKKAQEDIHHIKF